jgi:hypothetical protein
VRPAGCARALQAAVYCQVLLLRTEPLGVEHIDQRRTSGDHVARRERIDAFDEAGGACLHDADVALIELHCADGFDDGADRSRLDDRQAHPEGLLRLRRHGQPRGVARGGLAFVGITRDQLHVHERRLAGLVELLCRHHRVVPVQHLALCRCRCGRRLGTDAVSAVLHGTAP